MSPTPSITRASSKHLETPDPFTAAFQFEYVQAWHDFVTAPNQLTDEEALVLEEARLCEEDWHDTARAAFGRLCAVRTAPVSQNDDARAALDNFRLKRGLVRRADLDAWLVSNAAATKQLDQMMRDEASVTTSLREASPALDAAIVDYLRLTDRFAPLLRRALAKRGKLGASRPPVPGPLLDAALSWFSERVGRDRLGPEPGMWADEKTFHNAVWREYIFVHAEAR